MALCGPDHKKVLDRINRMEGQVRGLRKMVEQERECFEVLKQVAAIVGAARGLGGQLLKNHLHGCVTDALRGNRKSQRLVDELLEVFGTFAR